jgi:uncharacterized protein (DUF58 family)
MIAPTARTLALLALAAPLALVVAATAPAAWPLLPLAGLALLALVGFDGWLAGPLRDLRLEVPADAEVGQPFEVPVLAEIARRPGGRPPRAALGLDPRLGRDGAAHCTLAEDPAGGVWAGRFILDPVRRGVGAIDTLWLAWRGPLGLARRQARREIGRAVRVWPDLSPVRSPVLQQYLRDAQFGLVAPRKPREGTHVDGQSQYNPGLDPRQIDRKASPRHKPNKPPENEAQRHKHII